MAKAPADLRSLARAHTELSVQTLAGIARNSPSDQARVAAAQALLDRGWGRAAQVHSDPGGGPIQVIIRQIVDIIEEAEPVLIEHDDGCDKSLGHDALTCQSSAAAKSPAGMIVMAAGSPRWPRCRASSSAASRPASAPATDRRPSGALSARQFKFPGETHLGEAQLVESGVELLGGHAAISRRLFGCRRSMRLQRRRALNYRIFPSAPAYAARAKSDQGGGASPGAVGRD
jgi:hypothetical protein